MGLTRALPRCRWCINQRILLLKSVLLLPLLVVHATTDLNALLCQGSNTFDFDRNVYCDNASCPPCRIFGYIVNKNSSGIETLPVTLCFSYNPGTSSCPSFVNIIDCKYYPSPTTSPTNTTTAPPPGTGHNDSSSFNSTDCSATGSSSCESSTVGSSSDSSPTFSSASGNVTHHQVKSAVSPSSNRKAAVIITCSSIGVMVLVLLGILVIMRQKKRNERHRNHESLATSPRLGFNSTIAPVILPAPSTHDNPPEPLPLSLSRQKYVTEPEIPSTFIAPRVVGSKQPTRQPQLQTPQTTSHQPDDGQVLVYGDESVWFFPEDEQDIKSHPTISEGDESVKHLVFLTDPDSE